MPGFREEGLMYIYSVHAALMYILIGICLCFFLDPLINFCLPEALSIYDYYQPVIQSRDGQVGYAESL